ncbi:MAG: nucleotide exchange factor GrpE [Rikenellaceae bacterium]
MTSQKTENQNVTSADELNDNIANNSTEQQSTDTMAEETTEQSEESDTMAEENEAQEATAPREENVDWKDRYIRLQAEFDNYRKRTLKEKMDLVQSGGADTIKAFLPVVDDMQRALVAMEKSDDVAVLREGVQLIWQKLSETLKQRGVNEIEAVGLELDTDLHEAVARFAAGEEQQGKIIDVVQSGYTMGEKVLRFAKVVVGE